MKSLVTRFIKDKSGATAIEYGLIAALVSVVIIAGLNAIGPQLKATFTNVGTALTTANSTTGGTTTGGTTTGGTTTGGTTTGGTTTGGTTTGG